MTTACVGLGCCDITFRENIHTAIPHGIHRTTPTKYPQNKYVFGLGGLVTTLCKSNSEKQEGNKIAQRSQQITYNIPMDLMMWHWAVTLLCEQ